MEVTDYQLIYDGAGMHELKVLNAARMDARIAETTTNRALAEYLLRKLDYTNRNAVQKQIQSVYWNKPTAHRVRDDIAHIHKHCQEEIESKWQTPQLTDEQVADLLWGQVIQEELEKVKPKYKNYTVKQ